MRRLHAFAVVLWWSGVVLGVVALSSESPAGIAVCATLLSLGWMADDISRARIGGITPITMFALTSALAGLANCLGFLATDTPRRSQFFIYAVDNYLYLASLLALAGTVSTIIGFKVMRSAVGLRALFNWLPSLTAPVSGPTLLRWGPPIALFGMSLTFFGRGGSFGAIYDILLVAPELVVFSLARAATSRHVRGALPVALALACIDAARAFFFAYLRSAMVAPFAALMLGAVMGSRSLAPLKRKIFLPVYVLMALFIVYFSIFAQVRSTSGTGVQRIQGVVVAAAQQNAADTEPGRGLLARLSNFNQLSQIGQIVDQDGLLHGQTLEYMAYVFIPRFLWPDKPIVQKGGWFAWRIGQAWITPSGTYSNSVNMTIPGELYLNFGWDGVLLGCALFGMLIAVFWDRTSFWNRNPSALGTSFGFYLLWFGATLSADLQVVVTILAIYLTLVVLAFLMRSDRVRYVAYPHTIRARSGAAAASEKPAV